MVDEATRRWMTLDLRIALGRNGVEFDEYFDGENDIGIPALAPDPRGLRVEGPFFEGRSLTMAGPSRAPLIKPAFPGSLGSSLAEE